MRNVVVFLALLTIGCRESINSIKPAEAEFVEPVEGVSFISAEYEGKRFDYVEGKNGVRSLGISFSNFSSYTTIVGFGEALKDSSSGTTWRVSFYFTQDELKKNIANSTNLFYSGNYTYLFTDTNYNPMGARGTEIEISTPVDSSYSLSNTTLIQKDERPRSFTVNKVYFNDLTNNQLPIRLIWLEGSFEGWMMDNKKVKGRFRIKTQPNF